MIPLPASVRTLLLLTVAVAALAPQGSAAHGQSAAVVPRPSFSIEAQLGEEIAEVLRWTEAQEAAGNQIRAVLGEATSLLRVAEALGNGRVTADSAKDVAAWQMTNLADYLADGRAAVDAVGPPPELTQEQGRQLALNARHAWLHRLLEIATTHAETAKALYEEAARGEEVQARIDLARLDQTRRLIAAETALLTAAIEGSDAGHPERQLAQAMRAGNGALTVVAESVGKAVASKNTGTGPAASAPDWPDTAAVTKAAVSDTERLAAEGRRAVRSLRARIENNKSPGRFLGKEGFLEALDSYDASFATEIAVARLVSRFAENAALRAGDGDAREPAALSKEFDTLIAGLQPYFRERERLKQKRDSLAALTAAETAGP